MKTFQVNADIEIVCQWHKTSYGFKHTATLIYKGREAETAKCCYYNRTWERYEYESVLEKLADKTATLSEAEKQVVSAYIKNYSAREHDDNSFNRMVAMVATMSEVMGMNQQAKNDWKARMLKAGLEKQGLEMPADWDELSESEKEKRLNGAIGILRE